MRFTAYYTEGRVYKGDYDDWLEMPADGVLVIIEHRATGRGVFSGGDWYYADKGKIYYIPSGPWGTEQPKPAISCTSCIKHGIGVPNADFKFVLAKALRETYGNV